MPTSVDPKRLLASLYHDNHAWLRGWLSRQVRCPQDAADLTQDTFLRAYDARQLERIQEPRAYLSTVARRLLCSLWRRRKLEQSYLEQLADLPQAYAPSAEDIALVREAMKLLTTCLRACRHGSSGPFCSIASKACLSRRLPSNWAFHWPRLNATCAAPLFIVCRKRGSPYEYSQG